MKFENEEKPADFETAITATNFGKFNWVLLCLALPVSWGNLFETTTMSYVFPAAQCDLNLTLEDKGMLNAAVYFGTITSAFFWGFLFDTFGRRKLLMIGYFMDAVIVIISAFSPNKHFLMFMKFLGGFIINGPYAAAPTYLSEMHAAKYRSRMPLLLGVGMSLGSMFLPLLAAIILPLNFKISLMDSFAFHSWGFYLMINAVPSLLSGIIFMFLPESPKFLMSMGRNEEALKVFQMMFKMNTGKPVEMYPIRNLVKENGEKDNPHTKKTFFDNLKKGYVQIRPLFSFPHLRLLLLVCGLQGFQLMSLNTLRLWMPQLFQAINDYKYLNNGTSSSLCEMLSIIRPTTGKKEDCFVNFDNLEVYIKSALASSMLLIGYLLASSLINAVGQKRLLNIISFVASFAAIGLYFAPNSAAVTVAISAFKMFAGVGTNVIIVIIVNFFPTTLRTMTVSLAMMTGRGAATFGNLIFPYLLKIGCAPPFLSIAGQACALFFLSLLLPEQRTTFI
ncbi:synaptic vesicle 2-related protein-like isoform X2 [Harmonia axyridis]|uniref:synaptic vesicle 2-related protein-like isoform X2 n=1 Tax=Harmonia axyridis TaxID=115357 RepID=UPI001E27848C|nr:synaptic vesicle 2-related protein-like isoform X2 [Harmonia axyridis]